MPAYSSDTKKYHRARVRSIMVQNPMLAGEHIRRKLERDGLVLDRGYINGIVNEIHRERAKRADKWLLNFVLADFQDTMAEIERVGWEIANNPHQDGRDRAAALREIREARNTMFEKLFDAGVFERKLGSLDLAIRNTPLPEERKQAIRATFESWGLLSAPKEDAGTPKPTGDS